MSEETLQDEAARLAAFVACTADAIIAFGPEGTITHWNPGAERIFGYTFEEAVGQSYTLLGTAEVYEFQHHVFSETIRGDTHQWYDTRRRHKNGDMIDVSITTSPLIIHGRIVGLIAIVRDITEKVRAAKELHQRNILLDALAQEQQALAQQMADLNAQLRAQAEEKRQFVNMVIHDLRHPLTTMRTVLYLLRHDTGESIEEAIDSEREDSEREVNERIRAERVAATEARVEAQRLEYLEVIEGRVDALARLLNELTEYHRIEAGHLRLLLAPVDIGALVHEAVQNFSPALVGGQVEIDYEVGPGLEAIITDGGKLNHILLNLLSNALKFTPRGTISVRATREEAQHWILAVSDTGIGMSAELQSRVYEEFYQGEVAVGVSDPSTNRSGSLSEARSAAKEGFGLGLTIAQQLCTVLQGTLELTSVLGQGTRFQLRFPVRLTQR